MKLRPPWERPGAEPFSRHAHRGGEEDLTRRRRASPPSLSQVPRERSLGPHEVSVEELSTGLAAASLAGLSSDSAATVTYLCGETPGAAGPRRGGRGASRLQSEEEGVRVCSPPSCRSRPGAVHGAAVTGFQLSTVSFSLYLKKKKFGFCFFF